MGWEYRGFREILRGCQGDPRGSKGDPNPAKNYRNIVQNASEGRKNNLIECEKGQNFFEKLF